MDLNTANRLYDLRKAKGYSQDELADLIGVSRQAVSKWERGESSPDTDNLIALAKLYGVSIDELLDYKPQNAQGAQATQGATEQTAQSAQNSQTENANDTAQKSNVFVRIGKDGIEIHAPHSADNGTDDIKVGDFDEDDDEADDVDFEVCDDDNDNVDDAKDGTVDDKKHRFNVHIEDDGIRITSNGKQHTKDGVHIEIGDHPKNRNQAIKSAIGGGVFLLSIIAYLVMGFLADLWHPGWIIFFSPIIVDGIVDTILKRNPNEFPMPMLSITAFLLLGFLGGWWHPGWVVLLAIPAYFAIVSPIYSAFKKKDVDNDFTIEHENIDNQQEDSQE